MPARLMAVSGGLQALNTSRAASFQTVCAGERVRWRSALRRKQRVVGTRNTLRILGTTPFAHPIRRSRSGSSATAGRRSMGPTYDRGNGAHPGLTASPSGQPPPWPRRWRRSDGTLHHGHPLAYSTIGSRRASAVCHQRVDRKRGMGGRSGSRLCENSPEAKTVERPGRRSGRNRAGVAGRSCECGLSAHRGVALSLRDSKSLGFHTAWVGTRQLPVSPCP